MLEQANVGIEHVSRLGQFANNTFDNSVSCYVVSHATFAF